MILLQKFLLRLTLIAFISQSMFLTTYGDTIVSTEGNINFDSNNDDANEMQINSTGLGVHMSNPSANLHVGGNAIISNQLVVGGTNNTSNSTLHVNGTIGYSVQSLNAGGNVISSSIVLADTSSGNASLILPKLSDSIGMQIIIKRTSLLNDIILSGGGGNIEGDSSKLIGSGNLAYFTLINTGTEWVYLNNSEAQLTYTISSSNIFLWWALEETSGNSISDKSGFGRGGNLTNSHLFSGNSVIGPLSNGLSLDDGEDTAIYSDGSIPNNAYTYALWTKINFGSEDTILNEPEINGSAGFVWASGNTLFHRSAFHKLSSGNYVTTQLNSTLSANTWYHIAATYDGTNLSLYLNGIYESGNTAASWASSTNIILTNPGLKDNTVANTDELKVYDKALLASEIHVIFGAGSP
jgi:hypothetical protein